MWAQITGFFLSWFTSPSLIGIALAVAFGAVCLALYWPPLIRKPWLWAVLVASALFSLIAVSLIQIPLQFLIGDALGRVWSPEVLMRWLLLAGIPQILLSGLVQEGSKLAPVVVWWWRSGRNISPRMGLILGAVAGAGFGVFEAQWVHGMILNAGWTWSMVQSGGILTLAGFWERFMTVAFHTSVSALAGYGLARGWGWQFYLLAAFLHSLLNYTVVFVQGGFVTLLVAQVFITLWAVLVTGGVLWLRWSQYGRQTEAEVEIEPSPDLAV